MLLKTQTHINRVGFTVSLGCASLDGSVTAFYETYQLFDCGEPTSWDRLLGRLNNVYFLPRRMHFNALASSWCQPILLILILSFPKYTSS